MKYLILTLTLFTLGVVLYLGFDSFRTTYVHHTIVYNELQEIKAIALDNNKTVKSNGDKLDLILNIATNTPYYNDR